MNTSNNEPLNQAVASEPSISEVTNIKMAQARLQSLKTYSYWGPKVIAEAMGKPIYNVEGTDRRKSNLSGCYFEMFKILRKMFAVDQNLEYKHHPELFDRMGFRSTSRYELRTSVDPSCGYEAISVKQMTNILTVFSAAGFIERSGRGKMYIRFRADNVLRDMDRLAKLADRKPCALETPAETPIATQVQSPIIQPLNQNES